MGNKKPEVASKIGKRVGRFFKRLLRFYFKGTPECHCGWSMKPFDDHTDRYQWKCVSKACGWTAFEDGKGKLHWWRPRL